MFSELTFFLNSCILKEKMLAGLRHAIGSVKINNLSPYYQKHDLI